MRRREFLLQRLAAIAATLGLSATIAPSQTAGVGRHKFEVGAQVSLLRNKIVREFNSQTVQCVTTPCPPQIFGTSNTRRGAAGLGGRLGYNLNANVALEAELNFFPKADSFDQPEAFNDGHFIQGLLGVKAGKRFEKFGAFAKGRPGVLYAGKGDLINRPGGGCIAIFPPPTGCFQPTSLNSFALDVGAVVEVYPTARTLIRFDVGDTMIRQRARNVSAVFNPGPGVLASSRLVVIGVPAETIHNLQASVGIGFRF